MVKVIDLNYISSHTGKGLRIMLLLINRLLFVCTVLVSLISLCFRPIPRVNTSCLSVYQNITYHYKEFILPDVF